MPPPEGLRREIDATHVAVLLALVRVGAASSHLVEGRSRYPIDVMAVPIIATSASWLA